MARVRVIDRVLAPYLNIAVVVPMAVMMPVVLMALGLTRRAQIAVIVLFAVPFIVTATRDGARTIRADWTDMARVFGAREMQVWRRVLLPGSIAAVVAGLRLGFAQALTGLVTVELTLIALGIGKQMIIYQSHFQSADLFVYVALLMAQSVAFLSLLRVVEYRVSRKVRTR
jgi:ABC-type nitrate/sulfonate/bicarbonate transport system permease component